MYLLDKHTNKRRINTFRILFVLLISIAANLFVYISGGTQGAWTQLNFISIIFAAYYWQIKGGMLVAFLLGLIVGPFMPLNVSQGSMQNPENWMFRILIYLIVAFITGKIFKNNNEMNERIKEKNLISPFNGLYNTNKLFPQLDKMIEDGESFCLIFFNILNLEEISKYVDYNIINSIVNIVTAQIKDYFGESDLYSANFNEYILILKEYDEHEIIKTITKYLEDVPDSIKIQKYSFKLVIKIGIAFCNDKRAEAIEIFNEARVAADQGGIYESGVYNYDANFYNEKKLFHEISSSLCNAINNNEFYLVYQPIINLNDNTIYGAEVLVRWNSGERKPVSPDIFIKIAEEIGAIKEISIWIIKKFIMQLVDWKKKGIGINISVNLTAGEIMDSTFRKSVKRILDENGIDRSNLEIEITERMFMHNGKKLRDVLSYLRYKGTKISIDDFGTGYNSLMTAVEIPFDKIKIDKYFIEQLNKSEIKMLIGNIIEAAHKMGGGIIAEGVETKEQFEILKELGCDMIQGYYFSRPLLPEEFAEHYTSFDMNKYI